MERRKEERVADVAVRFLRQMGLETPLNEYRAVQAWDEVAGKIAERYTQNVYIRDQKLHVKLRSAVLRSELLMKRTELIRQINQEVGANVIVDICFS